MIGCADCGGTCGGFGCADCNGTCGGQGVGMGSWLSSILHKAAKPVAVLATVTGQPEIAAVAATQIKQKSATSAPTPAATVAQPSGLNITTNQALMIGGAALLGVVLIFHHHKAAV